MLRQRHLRHRLSAKCLWHREVLKRNRTDARGVCQIRTVKRVFPWTRSSSCETPVSPTGVFVVSATLAGHRLQAAGKGSARSDMCSIGAFRSRTRVIAFPIRIRRFGAGTNISRDAGSGAGGSGYFSNLGGSGRDRPAKTPPLPFPKGTPKEMDRFLSHSRC
jgi:hypothetical protein